MFPSTKDPYISSFLSYFLFTVYREPLLFSFSVYMCVSDMHAFQLSAF